MQLFPRKLFSPIDFVCYACDLLSHLDNIIINEIFWHVHLSCVIDVPNWNAITSMYKVPFIDKFLTLLVYYDAVLLHCRRYFLSLKILCVWATPRCKINLTNSSIIKHSQIIFLVFSDPANCAFSYIPHNIDHTILLADIHDRPQVSLPTISVPLLPVWAPDDT